MPNKIKIVLTLVAIVAVFLVYQLAQYVHTIANGDSTFQQNSPLPSPDDDPDHDGLSNQQEMIWGTDPFNPDSDGDGYKDGEEVNSGHNPLIPGPDDLVNDSNLTNQMSLLTLSGLYAGALNPASSSYDKSLTDIASSITDSSKYVFTKEIDPTSLRVPQSNPANDESYFKNLKPITSQLGQIIFDQYLNLENNFTTIGNNGFDDTVTKYYGTQASTLNTLLEQGLGLGVSSTFKNDHAHLMSLLQQLINIDSAIADGNNDPVKASLAFSAFGDIYSNYFDIVQGYISSAQKAGLDIKSLAQ